MNILLEIVYLQLTTILFISRMRGGHKPTFKEQRPAEVKHSSFQQN